MTTVVAERKRPPRPGEGRPRKYNKATVEEIKQAFEEYIEKTPIPILTEFTSSNWKRFSNLNRQDIYDYPEFSTLLKRLQEKRETGYETLTRENGTPTAFGIFALKQHGWRDRPEEVATQGGISFNLTIDNGGGEVIKSIEVKSDKGEGLQLPTNEATGLGLPISNE